MADVNDLEPYLETFDSATGYLDWAAFGPLSPAVRAEMLADAELLGSGRRSSIDLVTARVTEARGLVAGVLGCAPEEVVLQPSTTHGLFHTMQGLTGTVVVSAQDFPSLRVTARRAQDARGLLSVREIDPIDGIVTVDAVAAALDDDVTAVGVSLVDFRTGALADLAALRELIGDRLLIVDAIQGFGVTEADWAAADVVCANGYKWLRAGRGTGFARFSDRARERIEPVLSGISGMQGDATTPGVPAPLVTAAAYQVAPTDPLAAGRLAAALREMTDAGIPAIAQELRARARDVMDLADRYAVPVLTPRDRHAGIVTLQPAAHDAAALAAALANHGVTVTARGATIRVSPHVGTGADSLRLLGDALAEVAATRVVIDAAPGALALSEADIVPAPPALADAVGSDTAN
ncbi:aminotransferase class V-fold PLP-dependent enzyme [Microbacterium hominis]|uniref:aminotransferase class V-fold PLP-dependent enzyme n=1 Tax=Microbacterium TaxID=33882 RepID=UPI00168BD43D|nr:MULTISPECIES: aminotransferase class V-fold PLP-dependent enzyme [Microbacterium]QOC25130.1 aminotransferase class V-fold PLP-dependent enzyme [Microbacterium hominis]QOC29169.1 aminotransferase class V-fold PLP-dependent enzyme [Microbacterium hominis]QYF98613.1 aminotransferase class V-fold PLP-dependent enzyme [Microbacterium sp. PAMC21962]